MNRIAPESYYTTEATRVGFIFANPAKIDYVNENNIYMGFAKISYETLDQYGTMLIKNITDDTIGGIVVRYAYGAWGDRATLTYNSVI